MNFVSKSKPRPAGPGTRLLALGALCWLDLLGPIGLDLELAKRAAKIP